uniref:hypothetical protein n=1 Tax=uncultured Dysgonomonas sp. TaxID=206096 RepID=UPI0025909BF0|nr:hypothetical protein [uncultured Dysgonomonas sp.]
MDITFSEFEKQIIRRLVAVTDIEDRFIVKYIYDDSEYIAIEWDENFTEVTIYFKKQKADTIKTWDALCEVIFLFRKLEYENLVGIYTNSKDNTTRAIFDRSKYEKSETGEYCSIVDHLGKNARGYFMGTKATFYADLGKDLNKYSDSFIYVSQTLKDLVEDNFESKEQIRHEKAMDEEKKKHLQTMFWTKVAIGISVIIGVGSFGFSIIGTCTSTSKEIAIPLNSIDKNISDISLKIDSINSNTVKLNKDSLNIIP